MRKIVDLCFYFLLKKKNYEKVPFFLVLDKETPLRESASGCHRLLVEAYGNHTPTVQTVENWFPRFESCEIYYELLKPG